MYYVIQIMLDLNGDWNETRLELQIKLTLSINSITKIIDLPQDFFTSNKLAYVIKIILS